MGYGKGKTPDFSGRNIRTFGAKHRNFASQKSVLSAFPTEKRRKSRQNKAETANAPILQYSGTGQGVVASVPLLGSITAPLKAGKRCRE